MAPPQIQKRRVRRNNMMGYNFGFGGGFGMVVMALFWVAIIGLAIWLVGKLLGSTGSAMTTRSEPQNLPQLLNANETLKQRYARGEITKEQFEEMRRNIEA